MSEPQMDQQLVQQHVQDFLRQIGYPKDQVLQFPKTYTPQDVTRGKELGKLKLSGQKK